MALTDGEEFTVEEFYIREYMKNSYGLEFWLKAGGIFAISKKDRYIYLISGLYMAVMVPFFPLDIMTAYNTFGEQLEIVCEAVHFFIFVILEMIFIVSCILKHKVMAKILTIMGKGFYDYQNTLDEHCLAFKAKAMEETKRKKVIIAKVFIAVVMSACVSITILRPIVKYLLLEHHLGHPDDGLVRLVPMTLWTPFRKDTWYAMLFVFFMEDVIGYVTPGIVFGCTLFIVSTCEDVGTQLVILGHTLKSVARRAEGLNMPKEEALKLCFSHSIRHHQTLLKCVELFQDILYLPGLGLLVGSTILMCMSGFIFASKDVTFVSKLCFGMFLLSELMLIFLICWCGENLQKASTEVFDMVYANDWPDNIKSMKNYVLIIQVRTLKPIKISFGGLMVASLETYSNICSTTFSYFNLMLAMN